MLSEERRKQVEEAREDLRGILNENIPCYRDIFGGKCEFTTGCDKCPDYFDIKQEILGDYTTTSCRFIVYLLTCLHSTLITLASVSRGIRRWPKWFISSLKKYLGLGYYLELRCIFHSIQCLKASIILPIKPREQRYQSGQSLLVYSCCLYSLVLPSQYMLSNRHPLTEVIQ